MRKKCAIYVGVGILAIALVGAMGFSGPAAADEADYENLAGKRVAVLVGEGLHDMETLAPMAYLHNRGAEVVVVGVEAGAAHQAYNSAITVVIQQSVADVAAAEFDALVIPGGQSPAWLREHDAVLDFARAMVEQDKVVAGICHGPQVLATAGVLEGVTATCVSGVADEITEAGGEYVDEQVVRDGNIITSRIPDDIPAFNRAIEQALAEQI